MISSKKTYILIVLACLFLAGCGVNKGMKAKGKGAKGETVPTWHTCLIHGAKAVVTTSEERITADVTMQTVHDSLLIISVMPMLGMEMARLEATPTELVAFDKVHGRYAVTTYEALNRQLTPKLSWEVLQQLCSAELPTGDEKARLVYQLGKEKMEVEITYTPRKTDVQVRMNRLPRNKYKQVDISKWL